MRIFLLIALAAWSGSSVRAENPPPACVWVRAENDGSGAGFVVDASKRWMITCRHVVADRERVDVYFPWVREGELVSEKADYLANRVLLRERGLLVAGIVLKKSDDADLALVELESLPAGTKAVPLAANAARPSDSLRVVGHRLDLDTLFNVTTGPARQTGRLANGYHWRGKKLAANADAIIGQLPIEEGDSGGPVLNARGELVGMASALRRQTPSAAVAISVSEIRKFLAIAEPKVKPELAGIGDVLIRATVWIRPTASEFHAAGVLFEKDLILTSARGIGSSNYVGIAFPLLENGKFVGEREPYRDPVGLYLKGVWRVGRVVSRDVNRDIALIRVDSGVPLYMRPVPVAEKLPALGEAVHAMSHAGGLEFAWVYASGSVRQRGRLALAEGEKPVRIAANVLQLPAQAGSPGGPVLNERGELIGVLTARESAQQTGYAATTDEIAAFLDVALPNRPAKSIAGLAARLDAIPDWFGKRLAEALGVWSAQRPEAERENINRLALALDPRCSKARGAMWEILRRSGRLNEAEEELDRAIQIDDGEPNWLYVRALRRMADRQEWQAARGDLERALEISPEHYWVRAKLIRALHELKKDDEAVVQVGHAVRTAPDGLSCLAADLLDQADQMARKFPATPSLPANWLNRAIGAAHKSTADPKRKAECEVVLKAAAAAKDDAERLAILRAYLTKLSSQ